MKKFKVFFNIEKEEQWLNEQLQKGYRCTHISGLGIYTFEAICDATGLSRLFAKEKIRGIQRDL